VSDESKPDPPEPDEGSADSDRPTVAPPFDLAEFARSAMTPGKGVAAPRPPAITLSDPAELEEARKKSLASSGPDGPPTGRTSLLSTVNANSPSVVPPSLAPPVAVEELNELDRAWGDFGEVAPTSEPLEAPPASASDRAEPKRRKSRAITARPVRGGVPEADEPPRSVRTDEPFGEEAPTQKRTEAEAATSPPPSPAAAQKRRTTADFQGPNATADPATPPEKTTDPLQDMRDRYSLGDYTGALGVAESILDADPRNREAEECAESCRSVLKQMYTARIGPLDRVPVVMVPPDQLRWLSIDHKAGFVLSHIDGISSLEMILDVSGMPTLEALRILCELAQQRIISFR
jgi:hypothetical protein